MKHLSTIAVNPEHAGIYLIKAEQFLRGARRALGDGHGESAGLLAFLAAQTACFSITTRCLGLRPEGPGDLAVLELIETIDIPSKDELKQDIRGIVSMKSASEAEDRPLSTRDASRMVKAAERVVAEAAA